MRCYIILCTSTRYMRYHVAQNRSSDGVGAMGFRNTENWGRKGGHQLSHRYDVYHEMIFKIQLLYPAQSDR